MGEYFPSAPVNDEAKKRNGKLPGLGGIFNVTNLHCYNYSLNNPVKYTDPDGKAVPVIIAAIIIIAKAGAISAAVSGTIDIGKQLYSAKRSGKPYDPNQTWAAMAGGFIAGAVTGGTATIASNVGVSEIIGGNAVGGGLGSAVTTIIDNISNNKPVDQNLGLNTALGTCAGALSSVVSPELTSLNKPNIETSTANQSAVREASREVFNGVKDQIISDTIELPFKRIKDDN